VDLVVIRRPSRQQERSTIVSPPDRFRVYCQVCGRRWREIEPALRAFERIDPWDVGTILRKAPNLRRKRCPACGNPTYLYRSATETFYPEQLTTKAYSVTRDIPDWAMPRFARREEG
jgi:hypothetical protein